MVLTIRKQPSGGQAGLGRGEYELVGSADGLTAADFDQAAFDFVTPFGVKQSQAMLTHQGVKRRIRTTGNEPHPTRQIAALAMLPPPTRAETALSDALPVVIGKHYILDMDVAVAQRSAGMVTFRPLTFRARSARVTSTDEAHRQVLDADQRFAQIQAVYDQADELPRQVADAVTDHRDFVTAQPVIGRHAERLVRNIMDALTESDEVQDYLPGTDPLPVLAELLGLAGPVQVPTPPETPAGLPEIRRRAEAIYRAQRARGAGAARFRTRVQKAYDFRCAFCGMRAPTMGARAKSGVDAAHILPWGQFDLDVVPNGLMLCKTHHWAFDNRVVLLHATPNGGYELELAADWFSAVEDQPTLDDFQRIEGPLNDDWLPASRRLRPAKRYLDLLYSV